MRCFYIRYSQAHGGLSKNKHQVVAGYQDLVFISVEASAGCDSARIFASEQKVSRKKKQLECRELSMTVTN